MKLSVLAITIAAFISGFGIGAEIQVPADYHTIQAAIDASATSDVIIVSPGRYIENIDFLGKAITVRSINPGDPHIVESTIIDGNQAGTCVFFHSNESLSSVLWGFTITNGKSTYLSESGSGIYCLTASPLIMDCRIVGNSAIIEGGGLIFYFSRASIVRCSIAQNAGRQAGGISCRYSSISIVDCVIVDNTCPGEGSGLTCFYSDVVICGTKMERNGGPSSAALLFWDSTATVTGGTICGNNCFYESSVYSVRSSIRMTGVTIAENRGYGLCFGGSAVITNCIFHGNQTYSDQGGIPRNIRLGYGASLLISHCLISDVANTVLIPADAHVTWGPGIIDSDPMFVRSGHWDDNGTPKHSDDTFILGDYHLLPGSPCIDAGTNDVDNPDTPEVETLPATDIAGLRRVIDGNRDGTATVDIGAYEYLPGDVNYDGRVNVLDLILVRNSLGCDPASSIQARKADVNADGSVNVLDLLQVRGRLGR